MCSREKIPDNFPEAAISYSSQIYYLHQEITEIGRSMNGLIPLTVPQISRKHCIIQKTADNKFTISDLSVFGTFVNGKKLKKGEARELEHRDEINFIKKDGHSMVFLLNPSVHKINAHMSENMLNLSNSQICEKKKLDEEINKIEKKKSGLKKGLNAKLEAHDNMATQKRKSVSSDGTLTKEEVNNTLKEIEEKNKIERDKLKHEVEIMMKDITKKEEELQRMREDMESRHQEERKKLETKWQNEIRDIQEKLERCEEEKSALDGEAREVKEKLEKTKLTLLDSELEQHRIFESKVEVETELGSKIIDLQKEVTSKDEAIRELETKLKEKEESVKGFQKGVADLEEEIQCSICAEVFFEPTILNCGHMFCKVCINEWKLKKKSCPVCRAKIKNCIRMCSMDSIIEKSIVMSSTDAQERRQQLLERQLEGGTPAKRRRQQLNVPQTPPPMVNLQVTGTVPMVMQVNDPVMDILLQEEAEHDVFMWDRPRAPIATTAHHWLRPLEPVEVAAIDLTNVPTTPATVRINPTATPAMIDLTTP